jgi:cellulose synthase/poly-beta-1,6-N-acetylglucosamine synthase-like glycosyltransferase
VEIVRLDDIAFDSQVQAVERVEDIIAQNATILILAVIPASPYSGGSSSYLDVMFMSFWVISSTLFVFPIAVMVPWALIFKKRKRKPYAKWVPNYPTVSVILPAFNEEKNIGQSIERILGQHYRGNLEVIVIDDGSTDKTFQIAKSYADRYVNVKAIRFDKNRGKSHALNTGFAEAKGEVSVFSDTDSILTREAIPRMVSHFKDPEVGMVCGLVVIGNEKNLLQRLQQIEYIYGQTIIRFCQSSQKNVTVCPGSCTAVRTEIARKIPVTDRTIAEDADFTFCVLKEGWKVCQEPESIGYTDAPRNLKTLVDQRKRWSYGTLQTMSYHKWAARKRNPWVLKAWLECFLSPLVLLYAASFPLLWLYLGDNFPLFLLTYGMMPFAILAVNITIGLRLYNQGEKVKLAFLIPIYVIYGFMLNIIQMCMFLAFLSRRGVHIKRGGRIIHAV